MAATVAATVANVVVAGDDLNQLQRRGGGELLQGHLNQLQRIKRTSWRLLQRRLNQFKTIKRTWLLQHHLNQLQRRNEKAHPACILLHFLLSLVLFLFILTGMLCGVSMRQKCNFYFC